MGPADMLVERCFRRQPALPHSHHLKTLPGFLHLTWWQQTGIISLASVNTAHPDQSHDRASCGKWIAAAHECLVLRLPDV